MWIYPIYYRIYHMPFLYKHFHKLHHTYKQVKLPSSFWHRHHHSHFSQQRSQWQQYTRWSFLTYRQSTLPPCSSWTFTQVMMMMMMTMIMFMIWVIYFMCNFSFFSRCVHFLHHVHLLPRHCRPQWNQFQGNMSCQITMIIVMILIIIMIRSSLSSSSSLSLSSPSSLPRQDLRSYKKKISIDHVAPQVR